MKTPIALLALAGLTLTGCARTYQTADAWTPAAAADRQVDDAVAEALAAVPQMVTSPRVAVYSLDPDRTDAVVEALDGVDAISGVYALPPFLTDTLGYQPETTALRMLAAQARCDLLIIADHRWEQQTGVNGLVAFNALLLPTLFTPFVTQEIDSSLDSYVFDVRNGYLYGAISARQSGSDRFNTLYALESPELVEEHWGALAEETRESLAALLTLGG